MRLILGLDRPTSGNALVNGHPVDRSRRPLNEMERPIARSRDSSKADFTTVEITCICCQQARDLLEYIEKAYEERLRHGIPPDDPVLFLEVTVADPSEFEARLQATGEERHGYRILRMEISAVPNAIAAVLLHIRDLTGECPHIYFDWTEGNPVAHLLRFLIFGSGEVAPVTREVLREAEPDPQQRPFVHVA
jgi:hypothetical protein